MRRRPAGMELSRSELISVALFRDPKRYTDWCLRRPGEIPLPTVIACTRVAVKHDTVPSEGAGQCDKSMEGVANEFA